MLSRCYAIFTRLLRSAIRYNAVEHNSVTVIALMYKKITAFISLMFIKLDFFFYKVMLKKEACFMFYVIIIIRRSI